MQMNKMNNGLSLWEVIVAEVPTFYLVTKDDDPGDFAKQLAKTLGMSGRDRVPKPLKATRR